MQASDLALLGTVIQAVPLPAYVCEAPGGAILSSNPAALGLWGREPGPDDRFCGSSRLYRPDGTLLPHPESPMARALGDGATVVGEELVVERPDGSRARVLVHVAPLRDPSGRILGALNVLLDVTGREHAHAVAAQLAAIVESSDDAIISKDLDGIIQSWNRGAERVFGYGAAEVVGQPVSMLIPPEHADEETAILARIRRGSRSTTTRRCGCGRTAGGSTSP